MVEMIASDTVGGDYFFGPNVTAHRRAVARTVPPVVSHQSQSCIAVPCQFLDGHRVRQPDVETSQVLETRALAQVCCCFGVPRV